MAPNVFLAVLLLAAPAVLFALGPARLRRGKVLLCVSGACFLVAFVLLCPPVSRVGEAGHRIELADRLKRLALALYAYADDHAGRLPPAAVFDQAGKPLLSWRVLLLHYLDQEELYRQFRLDEPWDSPHNLALLARMPEAYAPPEVPGLRADPHATFYQVFVGKGAAFEGQDGLRLREDFPDGLDATIIVAEAGEAVPWTKPADLAYDPAGPLPQLGGIFAGRPAHVVLADGTVRQLPPDLHEATLRDAITRNDGRRLGPDW